MTRLDQLMDMASDGDEDVRLQVSSELALEPESARERRERLERAADEEADTYAPPAQEASERQLEQLAEDAGF